MSRGTSNSEHVEAVNDGEDVAYSVRVSLSSGTRNDYAISFSVVEAVGQTVPGIDVRRSTSVQRRTS